MIFVTVGNSRGYPFDRLIRAMDAWAAVHATPVLIQRGCSRYTPRHARYVEYLCFDEARKVCGDAQLIVGHCGTGTILEAKRVGCPIVVMPRCAHKGEVSDDNQLDLARALVRVEGIEVVFEEDDVSPAVDRALKVPAYSRQNNAAGENPVVAALRVYCVSVLFPNRRP